MLKSLRQHWPEYLMEAAELGLFMAVATLIVIAIEHPVSPVRQTLADPFVRRAIIGALMGLTATAIIYSPWGQRSGAHFNPAVTLTFLRLGKIAPWDACFYVLAQFVGGALGLLPLALFWQPLVAHPAVNYIATLPGPAGVGVALLAELLISFGLMLTVLFVSNQPDRGRWTGVVAGLLVAFYITFEAPLSGMSMNPARTLASALPAQIWTALWIYFVAPVTGMLLAAELFTRWQGRRAVHCAKLDHHSDHRCIFRCGYQQDAHCTSRRI